MTRFPANGGGGGNSSPQVYRLADNLTVEYGNFAEIRELWEQTVVDDQMLIEIVAASNDTMDNHARTPFVMDAVSTSTTAMDAVSASQTARDAVNASDIAFDTVAAVNMAIGKFVAGSAGLTPSDYADMDAVSTSTTAMDAVSTSTTAMDAVSASTTAMNAAASAVMPRTAMLLGAYYDSIFSSDDSSDRFFNNSVINPNSGTIDSLPYTYNASGSSDGNYDVSLSADTPSTFDGGKSLTCLSDDYENNDQAFAEIELDLSDASTLEYWAKDEGDEAVLLIDGSTVNNMGRSFNWTQFSIDVSGYGGTSKIGLGSNFTTSSSCTTYYTGLNLS